MDQAAVIRKVVEKVEPRGKWNMQPKEYKELHDTAFNLGEKIMKKSDSKNFVDPKHEG